MHLIRPLYSLAFFTAWATSSFAATYYVSPSGSDSNNGTSTSTPWATITKVNQITYAPGDSILFQGGQTFNGNIYFAPASGGNAANPITVSSYGTGRATINAGTSYGIFAYDNGGFAISNLLFSGSGTTVNTQDGVSFYNDLAGNVKKAFIQLQNVEITGFGGTGFLFGGANGTSGYSNVTATSCSFHDNLKAGAISYGPTYTPATPNYANSSVTFETCMAYNNNGNPNATTNTGSGISLGSVNGAAIENCVAHDNGINCKASQGPVGLWVYDATSATIAFNESYHNRTGGPADGDGFDFDQNVTNSFLEYNYSHENDGAGFLVFSGGTGKPNTGNVVRYNISQNDCRKLTYGALMVSGLVTNLQAYNNTIYISSTSATPAAVLVASSTSTPSNIDIRNNILQTHVGTTGAIQLLNALNNSTHLYQGNDYYNDNGTFSIKWGSSTYTSLSSWLAAATSEERVNGTIVGLNLNPQLANAGNGPTFNNASLLTTLLAYQLEPTSPMINAGLNLSALFGVNPGSQDFYDVTIPQSDGTFDIGASEYNGPNLASVASVQLHGTTPCSIALPLTGTPGVECRSINFSLQLVFTFDRSMSSGAATITSGTATINGSPTFSGDTMTVNLTGVTDAQHLTINVSGLNGTTASANITFGVLLGDVDGNGAVNSQDLVSVRNAIGTQVGSAGFNPRDDINRDGAVNSQDLVLVRNHIGDQLP